MTEQATDEKLKKTVLASLSALLLVPTWMLNAWVLLKLWEWFIVPVFAQRPLLLVESMGLSLFLGYATHQYVELLDSLQARVKQLAFVIAKPFFALLLGWLLSRFMP